MKVTKTQLKEIIKEELEAVIESFPNPEFSARAQKGHPFEHASEEEKCKRLQQNYDELMTDESYYGRSRIADDHIDRVIQRWREDYPCMEEYIARAEGPR